MIKDFAGLERALVEFARTHAEGCEKVYVAVSGGVDSSLTVAVLCKAFGPENVVGMYRNIRSDPKHMVHVELLQSVFGFKLICVDGNDIYDDILGQLRNEFERNGLPWFEENSSRALDAGFTNAYASLKSCLTTPLSAFIAKAIDSGKGRIFGTGNGEEDVCLRYFDKRGDGAVDNNMLAGLNKAEVRQMASYMGVPEPIILKTPSADLEARGDLHNDEDQLSRWAASMGYDLRISYGSSDGSKEGNIAWAWREDLLSGVVTGWNSEMPRRELHQIYGREKTDLIFFLREVEAATRHKVQPIPGLARRKLGIAGLVD